MFTGVYSKEGSPGGVRLAGIHFVNGIISILLSISVWISLLACNKFYEKPIIKNVK